MPKPQRNYEVTDASSRGIFITGFAALFAGFLIHVSVWWLFLTFKRATAQEYVPRSALAHIEDLPPEPRLQLNPRVDLLKMRLEDQRRLRSTGWVDQRAGIARIPIDDAMKVYLDEQRRKTK